MQGYLALAAVLGMIGSFVAGNIHGHKTEAVVWEVRLSAQKNEAAQKLIELTEAARQKESKDAELSRDLESTYQATILAQAANSSDREHGLLASLQRITGRWKSCDAALTAEANSPSGLEGTTPRGIDPVLTTAARDFRQLGESAERVGAWAKVCHVWSNEHGR